MLIVTASALALTGCGTTKPAKRSEPASGGISGLFQPSKRGGAYYQDDGPGDNTPANLDRIPDAQPRIEPYASGSMRPYNVFGKDYVPITNDKPFVERGIATWYGRKFHGQKTSSGEIYDMYSMTAAHPTLPIPSYARVTNLANGRSVIVRVNDRGPFHPGRVIDLSFAAAYKLGYANQGSGNVEVERILPRDISAGRILTASAPPFSAPPASSTPASAPPASASLLPPAAVAAPVAPTVPVAPAVVIASAAVPRPPSAPAADAAPSGTPAITPGVSQEAYADLPPDLMPTDIAPPATMVVPIVSTPTTAATGSSGYYLQLGAFRARSGADDLVRHLNGQLDAGSAERLRVAPGGDFYRVQLGPYADRAQAEVAVQRLRDQFEFTPMIVAPK